MPIIHFAEKKMFLSIQNGLSIIHYKFTTDYKKQI